MSQYNILVVDDDREIVRSLGKLLELEGYRVKKAYNGMEALDILMTEQIHLILLDVMMPKMNGLSALMKIREKNNIPIIMLSAKTEESDKVIGLSMGADDYVTKPYNTAELMARVKSQLRRYFSLGAANGTTQSQDILKNGGLLLNRNTKELLVDGEPVRLTATEYKIMELLMEHPGYVFFSSFFEKTTICRTVFCSPSMTERIWFFITGKSALPASKSRRSFPMRFTKSWQGKC